MRKGTYNLGSVSYFNGENVFASVHNDRINNGLSYEAIGHILDEFYTKGQTTDIPFETHEKATLNGLPIVAMLAVNQFNIGYSVLIVTKNI